MNKRKGSWWCKPFPHEWWGEGILSNIQWHFSLLHEPLGRLGTQLKEELIFNTVIPLVNWFEKGQAYMRTGSLTSHLTWLCVTKWSTSCLFVGNFPPFLQFIFCVKATLCCARESPMPALWKDTWGVSDGTDMKTQTVEIVLTTHTYWDRSRAITTGPNLFLGNSLFTTFN